MAAAAASAAPKRTAEDDSVSSSKGNGKAARRTVRVWCDGCYDMMHYGHANSLRQAKAFGDYLVVGVHSDESIRLHKGPPVMNEQERYRLVRACKWVDEVVEDAPYVTTVETLDQYDCDFSVHGDDITTTADGHDTYHLVKAAGRYRQNPLSALQSRDLADMSEGHTKSSPYTSLCHFLPTSRKIIQFSEGREPKPGDKIGYMPGAFDLFHIGHVDALEQAKKLVDFLIVGIYSDADVNEYRGSQYPIQTLHERVLSVLANKYVDEVVIGAPFHTSEELIKHFKVDIVIVGKAGEPPLVDGEDSFKVPRKLGILREIDSGNKLTTADIVTRIIRNRLQFEERNKKKEEKELKLLSPDKK